jgi:hypothetical protein
MKNNNIEKLFHDSFVFILRYKIVEHPEKNLHVYPIYSMGTTPVNVKEEREKREREGETQGIYKHDNNSLSFFSLLLFSRQLLRIIIALKSISFIFNLT